jgi:hypothetical protein
MWVALIDVTAEQVAAGQLFGVRPPGAHDLDGLARRWRVSPAALYAAVWHIPSAEAGELPGTRPPIAAQ